MPIDREAIKKMQEECSHDKKSAIPDSLARMCDECGKVWVRGEPWDYKTGNIMEWVEDLANAKKEGDDAISD